MSFATEISESDRNYDGVYDAMVVRNVLNITLFPYRVYIFRLIIIIIN